MYYISNDVLHRDLRWPNIIFYEKRFYLIDFETAASSGKYVSYLTLVLFFHCINFLCKLNILVGATKILCPECVRATAGLH